MIEVEFTEGAVDDYDCALEWYLARSQPAALRFENAVANAVVEIRTSPQLWPGIGRRLRFRRLKRFPYCLFYRLLGNTAYVVDVEHGRRKPGYWKGRK